MPSPHSAIPIEGSAEFAGRFKQALTVMRDVTMQWYHYSISVLNRIVMVPEGSPSGILIDSRTYQDTLSEARKDIPYIAGGIVHEACHVHQWIDGTATSGWRNELPCLHQQLAVTLAIDPRHWSVAWLQDLIANIRDPAVWWWTD